MKRYLTILTLSLIGFMATAQTPDIESLKLEDLNYRKVNDYVLVEANIVPSNIKVRASEMLVLTPVLHSNTSEDSLEFAPVVILGKLRSKLVERAQKLKSPSPLPDNVTAKIIQKGKSSNVINYSEKAPYFKWMNNARLSLRGDLTGCANCSRGTESLSVVDYFTVEKYKPSYKLTYIAPEAEPVKSREDRHTASFNYVVGKHDLLRDYKNNAAEFLRVDNIINDITSNKDFEITELTVSGYASPEGNFSSNLTLSDRRANSFAMYLSFAYGIPRHMVRVRGYGEDWDGLIEAVSKSDLVDKDRVLNIIKYVSNPDARDAEFKKLSGGKTWRTLLDVIYPPLRRTDYTVAYKVRAFSVEEAKEILKTNPKLLSLNELFLVAQTYDSKSQDYKQVFDIAMYLYPNEPIAVINSAAASLEQGHYNESIIRLNKLENDPRAWNNMGVAYANEENFEKAKEYFEKAAAFGDENARHNLEELKKL